MIVFVANLSPGAAPRLPDRASRARAAGSRRSTPTRPTTAAPTSATSAASSPSRWAGTRSRSRPRSRCRRSARCGSCPRSRHWRSRRRARRLTPPPVAEGRMTEKSEAAMRALLEGLPDAIVGGAAATARSCSSTRSPRSCSATARPSCSAGRSRCCGPSGCASATSATRRCTSSSSTRCASPRAPTALRRDGTEFVGEMSWGIVQTDDGPDAAGRRARHHRAPRGRAAAAPPVRRAGRGRRRSASARCAASRRRDLAREAAERVGMALSAERVLIVEPAAGGGRRRSRSPPGARGEDPPDARAGAVAAMRGQAPVAVDGRLERRDPHRRGGVRRDHGLRRVRRPRSSARSSSRSPTCSPPPTRACAPSSGSATRRCTTR